MFGEFRNYFLRSVGIISLIKQQQKETVLFFVVARETSLKFLF